MKQAIAQAQQIVAGYLVALFSAPDQRRVSARKGGVAAARRSHAGPPVDWQAWGTKSGLCWRAPRDCERHVPVGPPKSLCSSNSPQIGLATACQPAVYRRFPALGATIFPWYVSRAISPIRPLQIAPMSRRSVFGCALSAGAGKNAGFSSRRFFARGVLGLQLGCGVGLGFAQLIPTHQVTRGNQSRKLDSTGTECN